MPTAAGTNYTITQPNICPGCGRCRDCGQPVPVPPIPQWPPVSPQPWQPRPEYPFWQDPPYRITS